MCIICFDLIYQNRSKKKWNNNNNKNNDECLKSDILPEMIGLNVSRLSVACNCMSDTPHPECKKYQRKIEIFFFKLLKCVIDRQLSLSSTRCRLNHWFEVAIFVSNASLTDTFSFRKTKSCVFFSSANIVSPFRLRVFLIDWLIEWEFGFCSFSFGQKKKRKPTFDSIFFFYVVFDVCHNRTIKQQISKE